MNQQAESPEDRIQALGLELPAPMVLPPGLVLPFSAVNVRGERVLLSGHPKQNADGSLAGPYGKVGAELSTEEAKLASRDIALAMLSNLRAEIGSLSRVTGWLRVFGMVNSAAGYSDQHVVVNGFSDLIIEVFGPETGKHARSAIGVAGLPMNFAIEIEAEVMISPE